MNTSYGLVWP